MACSPIVLWRIFAASGSKEDLSFDRVMNERCCSKLYRDFSYMIFFIYFESALLNSNSRLLVSYISLRGHSLLVGLAGSRD